jgi:alpha/beta superfamily hydrolase
MADESVFFLSDGLKIEGKLTSRSMRKGVVITHPHPRMGGDMDNNVVSALADTFTSMGYTTLRFNFRGVGKSQGSYDGVSGEVHDLLSAEAFLKESGAADITLAGYSFGAWIINQAIPAEISDAVILYVSPPVDFMPFEFKDREGKIKLMIAGDRDPYCSLSTLLKIGEKIRCPVEIVTGADHFYWGWEGTLSDIVMRFF